MAQGRVPLADRVDPALLPSGISDLPIALNGRLVSIFQDEDGTDVLRFIGDFVGVVGRSAQRLKCQEAVVWLAPKSEGGKNYQQLQLFLWKDAELEESGGTVTGGPALFVTLNSTGSITTESDDVAFQRSPADRVYDEGNRIRKSAVGGAFRESDSVASLRVMDASGLHDRDGPPKPRPVLQFQSKGDFSLTESEPGRFLLTVTGGAYLARGASTDGEFLEVQADAAVVFLAEGGMPPRPIESPTAGFGGRTADSGSTTPVEQNSARASLPKPSRSDGGDRQLMSSAFGDVGVESVYLEGDVRMAQGSNVIRASRLYYDFTQEQAVLLDAVFHAELVDRGVPIYIRASQVRQISRREFVADRAVLTTSEFHTPHYHIGAGKVQLLDRTPESVSGRPAGITAGGFRVDDATFNVGGVPVGYWPHLRGSVSTSETAIRSVRAGYSGDLGVELETSWFLFNLLGLESPDGVDATLKLDEFTERGPAIGIDAEYTRDRYYGELKSYLLTDDGRDDLGREREDVSAHDVRGRYLLRHRQYLEDDWQLTLEFSYLSDRGFLEEFFESEFDNGKEQETLLYLKRQRDNWAFTTLLQARILDFTTQTERYPDFAFFLSGESLGDHLSWFSENRLGELRYRPADQTFREFLLNGPRTGSDATTRADTRQEIGAPVDVGFVRMVPYASVRGSTWTDSPDEGAIERLMGSAGVRGSMILWRTYPDFRSELLDIHGVRHLIKPTVTAWVSGSSVDSTDLYPFDDTVDRIDDFDGATFGVRQRWQTHRGEGEQRRVVDVLTSDMRIGAFNEAPDRARTNGYTSFSRPEESIARNFISSSTIWRINDRTALLTESNYDLNDQHIDIYNVSLAVERSPRLSYLVGYRYINETDSNLLAFDMNYRMTEKHMLALREAFDLDEGRTLDFTVGLIRRFPRWYGAISFALDNAEDDFGVSLSIWPEGLPQAALGSRRFTGLASSMRLEN